MARKAPPKPAMPTWALVDDALVGLGLGRGEADRLDRVEPGGDGDDRQREDDPHAEHGDGDAPGQEAAPPFLVHVLEHGGVDHRIVEGQRDFEDAEDEDDPDDRRACPTTVPVSSQPSQAPSARQTAVNSSEPV